MTTKRIEVPGATCWLCGGPPDSGACACHSGAGECDLICRLPGDKDVPEDFKEGMRDIAAGQVVDL